MPSWLKALLIVAIVIVLLMVGVVGAALFWWTSKGRALKARGREMFAEGSSFGRTTDNQGCVDETFLRYKKEPGFFSGLNHSRFMEGCLKASRPTPGFCERIPLGDFWKMTAWREAECKHYDVPNDQGCGQLVTSEMMYCGEKKRGSF